MLSYLDQETGCWIWLGKKSKKGYGHFSIRVNGRPRNRMAHRVAYEELTSDTPGDFDLDHKCRNYLCINPMHMEKVTKTENNRRRDIANSSLRT